MKIKLIVIINVVMEKGEGVFLPVLRSDWPWTFSFYEILESEESISRFWKESLQDVMCPRNNQTLSIFILHYYALLSHDDSIFKNYFSEK